MKSKHSGMLRRLYLLVTFGVVGWNLNTVECWGSGPGPVMILVMGWNLNTVECWDFHSHML